MKEAPKNAATFTPGPVAHGRGAEKRAEEEQHSDDPVVGEKDDQRRHGDHRAPDLDGHPRHVGTRVERDQRAQRTP